MVAALYHSRDATGIQSSLCNQCANLHTGLYCGRLVTRPLFFAMRVKVTSELQLHHRSRLTLCRASQTKGQKIEPGCTSAPRGQRPPFTRERVNTSVSLVRAKPGPQKVIISVLVHRSRWLCQRNSLVLSRSTRVPSGSCALGF